MKLERIMRLPLELLHLYYSQLNSPLADLNAHMMHAWNDALNLRYHISDDGVLYVLGDFQGLTWGWGPPIGKSVSLEHIETAFLLLDRINNGRDSGILYLWQGYPLFSELMACRKVTIIQQANEYIYKTRDLATLPGGAYRKLRYQKNICEKSYAPRVEPYSSKLSPACIQLADAWKAQKAPKIRDSERDKFEMEFAVCRNALARELPLLGITVFIRNSLRAFSIGAPHSRGCFNCMFEKTDLAYQGLAAFTFNALGKALSDLPDPFDEINAGEDWGVSYLSRSKTRWKPTRMQANYCLRRRMA